MPKSFYFYLIEKLWVLPIMPNRPVRDQRENPQKMEWHFPIKPGQPVGMALTIFHSFSEFPSLGKEPVCQKWNGEFRSEYSDWNKWTTSRGDSEYSGRKKLKRTFPFEFPLKFPESLAKWKALYFSFSLFLRQVARRATKRSPILIEERKGKPWIDFLMVIKASDIARGHVHATAATTKSCKMAAIP